MTTAEILATAIGGWFLVSFLIGLAAGWIIQICRARCSRLFDLWETLGEPTQTDETDSDDLGEGRNNAGSPRSLRFKPADGPGILPVRY